MEGKLFFVWINFWGLYILCIVLEFYYLMYCKEDVVLDESFFKLFEGKLNYYCIIFKMWGMWEVSEDYWKEVIIKFWGYIILIDDVIGDFFIFFEEKGIYDSSFIVVIVDYGDVMGVY